MASSWEYRTLVTMNRGWASEPRLVQDVPGWNAPAMEGALQEFGADGWELVAVVPTWWSNPSAVNPPEPVQLTFFFKRPTGE